jgi:hypothetical protein
MHDLRFSNNRNLTLNHSNACLFGPTKFDLGYNVVDGVWWRWWWCVMVVVRGGGGSGGGSGGNKCGGGECGGGGVLHVVVACGV